MEVGQRGWDERFGVIRDYRGMVPEAESVGECKGQVPHVVVS